MAVERQVVEREVVIEHGTAFEGMRVSWGSIWGGALVVLGTLLVLTTLGIAIGVSVDAGGARSDALDMGAAVWSGVSLLVALFIGGAAATRMSMVWDRATALLQGALVWVTSLVIVLYLNAVGIGLIFGSALGIASRAAVQLSPPATTAWLGFAAVVLSLLCALAGSAVGRRGAAERAGRLS